MKNIMRIDFENGRLIMDRAFAKKAQNPTSQEYAQLQSVRHDYPDFRVVQRTIRTNPQKETYAGLTYTYMENYIILHESSDTVDDVLTEYHELRLISQCHGRGRRYPVIKSWFLKKYPQVAEFGVAGDDNATPPTKIIPSFKAVDTPIPPAA